ncbi:hypothetical protein LP420_12915 [Massilia sp. B-10]|nr:hypothetical protein LP420_12915 [Massilia sp. B-10]
MGIAVNGADIDDATIERELVHHRDADNPAQAGGARSGAAHLAAAAGRAARYRHGDDDERIEALLALQVQAAGRPTRKPACATTATMRRATRAATWSKRATFCSRSRRAFRSTCCAPRAKRCWTN